MVKIDRNFIVNGLINPENVKKDNKEAKITELIKLISDQWKKVNST